MKAEIITIGDEILIGQIVDTNSQWMGVALNKIGVSVSQITSIQDDTTHILKAFKQAAENADIVLVTGGLGPTKDDITKHAFARFFEDKLVLDEAVVTHVKSMFAKRGIPFTDLNRDQGLVPSKSTVLHNALGTAPGMWVEDKGAVFVSMPGVPYEMKALMTEQVLPRLQKKFTLPHIQHTTLMTYGMGESSLSKKIESWENNLPSYIRLAYLPSPGVVKLRLSGKGFDKEKLANDMAAEVRGLEKIIPELIVGFDREETIQVVVSKLFKEAQATLSLAESCSGGFIAQLFTAIPGASNFFKGAVVAYTEAVKKQELGVSQKTLDQNTVVSKEVAVEMALGAQLKFNSDYAIATTGNAGPSAGHTDKPVGVVCIAIATPKGVFAEEFNFGSPREKVIQRCANKALELLRKEIIKNYAK